MAVTLGSVMLASDVGPYLCTSKMVGMWHGTIANIPAGWVICDGNNSTLNLLTKFIEGVATAATNPGATGGSVDKTANGHTHVMDTTYEDVAAGVGVNIIVSNDATTDSSFDEFTSIFPKFYDVAFIMKT